MPGSLGVADRRDLGEAGQEAADEGAVAVPGAGVHHQSGRLVDDHDVVVRVDDLDGDVGLGERSLVDRLGRRRRARPRSPRRGEPSAG